MTIYEDFCTALVSAYKVKLLITSPNINTKEAKGIYACMYTCTRYNPVCILVCTPPRGIILYVYLHVHLHAVCNHACMYTCTPPRGIQNLYVYAVRIILYVYLYAYLYLYAV